MVAMYNPLDQETVAQPKLSAPISSYANPATPATLPATQTATGSVAPPAPAVPKAPVEQKPVPTVLPAQQQEIGYTKPGIVSKAYAPQGGMSSIPDEFGPGSQFYRLPEGKSADEVMTYKGIVDADHPDGIYQDTYGNIAKMQARMIASQQGFQGGTPPAGVTPAGTPLAYQPPAEPTKPAQVSGQPLPKPSISLDQTNTAPSGLVASKIPVGATQATNSSWDVNGDQLVEDRTSKIIGKDSELMQRAKAEADQQSNARGLINSSMAVGAGQAAVLDRAVDIAKSDANTFAQSAQFNADSKNKLSTFNAGADNQFKLADKSIDAQAVRDANQQTFDLAKMDKQAATTLSQMSVQQQNDLAKLATQQGYNIQNMSAQNVNDLAKLATQQGYNIQNMSAQNVNDLAKLDKQIKAQADQQAAQLASNRDMFAMQTAANQAMQEVQLKNSALLSASGNAASILSGTQGRIASIMQDQNLDGPAKQAAIDRLNENAQVSINLIGKLSGDLDLSDALSALLG